MSYLHGVETVTVDSGPRPVKVVKAGVIGIVGTDPRAEPGMYLIKNPKDAAETFGVATAEYTLRKAIDLIQSQGDATIVAINVYDAEENTAAQEDELTVANGKVKTAFQPDFYNHPFVVTSEDGLTTYDGGTHYQADLYGNITILDTIEIPDATVLIVTYNKHLASYVLDAQIVGAYDDGTDLRSGLFLLEESFSRYGFTPKILVAPVFCERSTLTGTFVSRGNKHRLRTLVDAPANTLKTDAIEGRGPLGTINFNTSSRRMVLCYPHFNIDAPWSTAGKELMGLSVFIAGVWSNTINVDGYWFSPSNREMNNALDPATILSSAINDTTTDVNALNEVGIVTYFTQFGTGYRTWGNRSAAWPTVTTVDNFLPVLLTADVIDESIEYAMLPFIDKPITEATIMSIKETVNQFLNTLVQRGAVLPGAECIYDPADNPVEELALGHLTFLDKYLPPTPAERITFKRYLATELLANLSA